MVHVKMGACVQRRCAAQGVLPHACGGRMLHACCTHACERTAACMQPRRTMRASQQASRPQRHSLWGACRPGTSCSTRRGLGGGVQERGGRRLGCGRRKRRSAPRAAPLAAAPTAAPRCEVLTLRVMHHPVAHLSTCPCPFLLLRLAAWAAGGRARGCSAIRGLVWT